MTEFRGWRASFAHLDGLAFCAPNRPSTAPCLGDPAARAALVQEFRQFDARRLYAQASNYDFWKLKFADGDDYWTTFRTRAGVEGNVRGSYAHVDAPLGHVQSGPPAPLADYSRAIAGVPVPVIGHEIGQYQVYPNFAEIRKYTGVLRAWNFEVFRDRLRARGMLDQAGDFFRASGALAVLNYREEIEAALRTRGFGGFQLLDLQDFPGQGTALVGILDAFMDSKGLIEPAAWREFCSATVPLVVMPKYVWTADETLGAEVKVAHYGPAALPGAVLVWALTEDNGHAVASGQFAPQDIPTGDLTNLGRLTASLAGLSATPRVLSLTVELRGTKFRNHYRLWVYPAKMELPAAQGQFSLRQGPLNDATLQLLARGGRVLLFPEAGAHSVPGFFASDFWCYPMFRRGKPPGTLGLLCDPRHPALAQFPTAAHSDYQWWTILTNSAAFILDDAPSGLRPIVQVIDNFDTDRNHKLGLVFEARVGQGSLLVCGSDLPTLTGHPEARQLLASLLAYANSDRFKPTTEVSAAWLQQILAKTPPRNAPPL